MAEELRDFPDVLMETAVVCTADEGGESADGGILGAAYLTVTSSFFYPQYGDGRCFLRVNFQALPGSEQEIEASALLLRALQESLLALQERDPKHRLILQVFADAGKLAYTEFLMDCGFFPRHLMLAMECDLNQVTKCGLKRRESAGLTEASAEFPEAVPALPKGLRLTRHTDPDEFSYFDKHFKLSKAVFGVPDSIEELRFRLRHGTTVWAVMEGEKLIASMAAARINEETAAVEGIFCRKAYRRRGITAAMMTAVLEALAAEGFRRARLTLFSDNLPAFSLYRKLGFELAENILEFHYEENPGLRGY